MIESLYLKSFRAFGERLFRFDRGVNLFWGENAQGKTTILEAIYLLMTGRSFRTSHLNDMIQQGAKSFMVEAIFEKHGISQHLRFYTQGKVRQITYNHTPCTRTSHLWGILPGLVMTPDDDALIKGGPAERRRFLDLQLTQSDPLYVHHYTRYSRALKQRNQLLRQKLTVTLDAWEYEMALSGSYLVKKRAEAIQALAHKSCPIYRQLSGTDLLLSLEYNRDDCQSQEEICSALLAKLQKHRPKELMLGFTFSGPHKDDFLIKMDQQEVRTYASEGQKRITVAALKLAAWSLIKEYTEQVPLLLIDDLNLGLDASRRQNLLDYVQNLGQVFLTSTSSIELPSVKEEKISIP